MQVLKTKIGAIHNIEGRIAWNRRNIILYIKHTKKRKKNQTTFKHTCNLNANSIESLTIQQPLRTGLLE